LCPAFLLLLLACSAQVTIGKPFDSYESYESFDNPPPFVKRSASSGDSWDSSLPSAHDIIDSTMDKIRKDFEKEPLLSGLVKRSASGGDCSAESAGCAPGTEPASINNVCKCLTPEQLKNEMAPTMDKIRKDFEKNPLLSGLVKRNAASDSCSAESAGCAPGTQPASINNVCKCLTPEQLKNEMAPTMDKIRKDFEKNPLLSGLVKRNAASDSCSAESAGCAPGTQPASINNVCKCLTPEQLKNALNSAMDGVVQKFPWMSGLVKRSASSSECRAGCAPPTKEIWQYNAATGASVCKCLRPEQYLP